MNRRSLLQLFGLGAAAAVVPVTPAAQPVAAAPFDLFADVMADVEINGRVFMIPTRVTLGDRWATAMLDSPITGTVGRVALRRGESVYPVPYNYPFCMNNGDSLSIMFPLSID